MQQLCVNSPLVKIVSLVYEIGNILQYDARTVAHFRFDEGGVTKNVKKWCLVDSLTLWEYS